MFGLDPIQLGMGVVALFAVVALALVATRGGGGGSSGGRPRASDTETELLIQAMLYVSWADGRMDGREIQAICETLQKGFGVNVTVEFVMAISKRLSQQQIQSFPTIVDYLRVKISPPMRDMVVACAIGVACADRRIQDTERTAVYTLAGALQAPSFDRAKIDAEIDRRMGR